MPGAPTLIEDLLALGGGLFGSLTEQRHDMRAKVKGRIDGLARTLDLVSREEFDAAFAMLAKARTMQDELAERIETIEAHLGLSTSGKKNSRVKSSLPSVKQGKKSKRAK